VLLEVSFEVTLEVSAITMTFDTHYLIGKQNLAKLEYRLKKKNQSMLLISKMLPDEHGSFRDCPSVPNY
jgi:hypothetical protein